MSFSILVKTVRNFAKGMVEGLPDPSGDRDPLDLFAEWFEVATESNIILPDAMTLATSTPDGRPSARMVLLKEFGTEGFTFFTNYTSRKGEQLDANPHAALVFHWEILQRQVRIEGTVARISSEESEDYFKSRPRGSQIGAWASRQSSAVGSRSELEQAVDDVKRRFDSEDVPLPPFWGGYRLKPERMEFWQGKASRLHDRILFRKDDAGAWATERLYP